MQVAAIDVLFAAMPLTFTGKIKKQGFARKPALLRGTESRQKPGGMALFCLPAGPNSGGENLKVDKKRKNCFFFVYLTLQNRPVRHRK